jgi:hypothetical protein
MTGSISSLHTPCATAEDISSLRARQRCNTVEQFTATSRFSGFALEATIER